MADFDRRARPPADLVPRYRKELDESQGVLADIGGINQSIKELVLRTAQLERTNAVLLEQTETLANQIAQLQVTPEEIEMATEEVLATQQDILDGISRVTTDNEALRDSIQMVLSDQNFLETQIQAALTANPQIIREIVVREVEVQTTTTDTIIQNTVETIIANSADVSSAVDDAIDDLLDVTDTRIDDLVDTAVTAAIAVLPAADDPDIDEDAIRTIAENTVTGLVDALETELTGDITELDTELTADINRANTDLRTTVRSSANELDDKIDDEVADINATISRHVTNLNSRLTNLPDVSGIETQISAINARLNAIELGVRVVCHVGNNPPANPQVGQLWYDLSESPAELKVRGSNFWGRV